jgi:hypothetical protein
MPFINKRHNRILEDLSPSIEHYIELSNKVKHNFIGKVVPVEMHEALLKEHEDLKSKVHQMTLGLDELVYDMSGSKHVHFPSEEHIKKEMQTPINSPRVSAPPTPKSSYDSDFDAEYEP